MTFAEDGAAADLIAGGRLQLGLSRGAPEQVFDGWKYFGFRPGEHESDADMARRHTLEALDVMTGQQFARPNPRPMFPNPPGLLALEPQSEGLRERIWWGAGSDATARWAAQHGMNLMSSTLKDDETGEPFHVQQRKQIEAYREEWAKHDHGFTPRVSVSRSIFAITNDQDKRYFLASGDGEDQFGIIDNTRSVFGRSYVDEPDMLIDRLRHDEAIQAADALLLTAPNQLRVAYCISILEKFAEHVASSLGWRPNGEGPDEGYVI